MSLSDFIWLEWNSCNSSMQFHIVWSRSSIFKLKSSPAQVCLVYQCQNLYLISNSKKFFKWWRMRDHTPWQGINLPKIALPLLILKKSTTMKIYDLCVLLARLSSPLGWGGLKFENWWTWPSYIELYTRIIAVSL